jgi:hypothetical protein
LHKAVDVPRAWCLESIVRSDWSADVPVKSGENKCCQVPALYACVVTILPYSEPDGKSLLLIVLVPDSNNRHLAVLDLHKDTRPEPADGANKKCDVKGNPET